MIEHQFGSESGSYGGDDGFDIQARVCELRCHTTPWLETRRAELVRDQARLHVEELAVLAVLDERGRADDSIAQADGVTVQTAREKVETARAIVHAPRTAAAAHAGNVSPAQLAPAVQLASETGDDEVADRARHTSPGDLQAELRRRRAPTAKEFAARHARRNLRWWWNKEHTFLSIHGELPDLQGSAVEQALDDLVERARPAKGAPRDTWDQRRADAFSELCATYATVNAAHMPQPLYIAHCVPGQPVTINGIPVPDELVEAFLPAAKIELVTDDVHGAPVSLGRPRAVMPKRHRAAVLRRDGKCRYPGCDRRTLLQVHHLLPVSWGGTDSLSNLATVCLHHHHQLAPHGDQLLIGNPNRTDGLRLIRVDQLGEHLGDMGVPDRPDTG